MRAPDERFPFGNLRRALGTLIGLAASAVACSRDRPPVAVLRVEPSSIRLPYGEYAPVRFRWVPLRPLENKRGRIRVFVHLIDRPNHVLRTFDYEPPDVWVPGVERIDDLRIFQSILGAPLPPGLFTVTAGIYDIDYGYRWRLVAEGQAVSRREYDVARVRVPARRSGATIEFSGDWSEVEKGADSQILGRRRLRGSATIHAAFPTPGTLWVVAGIPRAWSVTAPAAASFSAGPLRVTGVPSLSVEALGEGRVSIDAPGSCLPGISPQLGFELRGARSETPPSVDIAAWAPMSAAADGGGHVGDRPVGKVPPIEEKPKHR